MRFDRLSKLVLAFALLLLLAACGSDDTSTQNKKSQFSLCRMGYRNSVH